MHCLNALCVCFCHSLEVYNDETAPLIDFYTATGTDGCSRSYPYSYLMNESKTDRILFYGLCSGALRTFEVKKGLADLDKLVDLINAELGA